MRLSGSTCSSGWPRWAAERPSHGAADATKVSRSLSKARRCIRPIVRAAVLQPTPPENTIANDLWLNLPIQDLARAVAFYEALGLERAPGPGNTASSACFRVGDNRVVLMLFLNPVFAGFAGAPVADAALGAEVLLSLGASSPAEVDALATRAAAGGGVVFAAPGGHGGMYGCGLQDPDGHRWNVLHMGGGAATGP